EREARVIAHLRNPHSVQLYKFGRTEAHEVLGDLWQLPLPNRRFNALNAQGSKPDISPPKPPKPQTQKILPTHDDTSPESDDSTSTTPAQKPTKFKAVSPPAPANPPAFAGDNTLAAP